MALNVVNIRSSYNNDAQRILYTCPPGKISKLVFVSDRGLSGSPSNPFLNNHANRVRRGGRLLVGSSIFLNSSTQTNHCYYMFVNPFLEKGNMPSTSLIVGCNSNGQYPVFRYFSDSELIITEGESVSVFGDANVSIKIFEEDV